MGEMAEKLNLALPQKEIGHFIAEKASDLSNLMSGSNGRDKICALVQYTVQLYSLCMRHSDELWSEESEYVKVSERIVDNISLGRKIFKFLKFLEPLKKLHEYHTSERNRKPVIIRVLQTFSFIFAFQLYLSDNILWLANMGIIKKMIFQKVKWKRLKDFFALWKNVIEIIKYVLEQLRNLKKQHDVKARMEQLNEEVITQNSEAHELVRKLIILRQKLRYTYVAIFQNSLRILMLLFRLRMPIISDFVHPITVSICGIISNYLGILKLFKESKRLVKLKKVDNRDQSVRIQDSQIVAEFSDNLISFFDRGTYGNNSQDKLKIEQNSYPYDLSYQIAQVNLPSATNKRRNEENQKSQFKRDQNKATVELEDYNSQNPTLIEQNLKSQDKEQSFRNSNFNSKQSEQKIKNQRQIDFNDSDDSNSLEGRGYPIEINEGDDDTEQIEESEPIIQEDYQISQQLSPEEEQIDEIYDKNARDPKYKLYSLRRNSTAHYLSMMKMNPDKDPMLREINSNSNNL
ncbi:pex11 domain containing protein [Stylonychia lemnae]|uniref:Pex11 domain containing protein n=1 Tax=Stylonychia lemnae TaxID=5949 RepID=A0A078AGX9_STYLE|nr:pex11 domain containing protein [Stylonychia lemnae]|eukprot:CDW81101.1 pex11 domain containing protein [Stylonychia lemnae]